MSGIAVDPLDLEIAAESLIALYGCAVAKGSRKVRRGEHPGRETRDHFLAVLRDYRSALRERVESELGATLDAEDKAISKGSAEYTPAFRRAILLERVGGVFTDSEPDDADDHHELGEPVA